MGHRTQKRHHLTTTKSQTLPSSPTHSPSSSDFEFTISLSPRKSSAALCPADELFYKGQILPLHLSPRLSMVRTLLLSSDTSSSTDTSTTASRDSTASTDSSSLLHSNSSSARPSSATDDELKILTDHHNLNSSRKPSSKYFSLSKFSSVFRKNPTPSPPGASNPPKRVSSSAKDVIRKYLKKVKPLYERLNPKPQQQQQKHIFSSAPPPPRPPTPQKTSRSACMMKRKDQEIMSGLNDPINRTSIPLSFSGNLRYPIRGRSFIASCPSSMGSSPSHGKSGSGPAQLGRAGSGSCYSDTSSSMEELQSAIQGAIAHCKNSMMQSNKNMMVSNEI